MFAQLKYCFLVLLIAGYASQDANARGYNCQKFNNDKAGCKRSQCIEPGFDLILT
eukprot:Pgem_evm1s9480